MTLAAESSTQHTRSSHAVYLRNMAMLWRYDPQLAMAVESVPDHRLIAVDAARSGSCTAAMTGPDGQKINLHSRYDPQREADSLAESVPIDEQYCFIVSGLGLGHHVLALRQRLSDECVIIVTEPSMPLIAAALRCVDFTSAMKDGRLILLTEPNKAELHERLRPHTTLMMLGARFVSHPPSQRLAAEFHRQMRRLITDFVAYSRMSIMTLVSNSEITCRNIAHNLPLYVTTPPINVLRDRFKGTAAIVVSAGPSLRRNMDQLLAAKGKSVICAVQTTLKPLLSRGIVPDFVTSLDFHEVSRQYFEGAEGLDRVHLVAEPKATWHVLDDYPGPISMLDNAFARLLVGDELAGRDGLPAGATVAHLAFYLAQYMGCDPIIFVGQDLAFSAHAFYIPGVEIHRTWRSEMNRFCTLETKEWDRITRNRPILRKVPANHGGELYTDDLLFTYLEQFEKDISVSQARVINATEGGARIRGTDVMSLADALRQFCQTPIPPKRFDYLTHDATRDIGRLESVRDQLNRRLDEVSQMADICDDMLKVLKKLQNQTHDPDRFNRTMVRVDELRAKVNASHLAYRLINAVAQVAELRRFSADRRLVASGADGPKRALQQLKRDVQYVSELQFAAEKTQRILRDSLERIDQHLTRSQQTTKR